MIHIFNSFGQIVIRWSCVWAKTSMAFMACHISKLMTAIWSMHSTRTRMRVGIRIYWIILYNLCFIFAWAIITSIMNVYGAVTIDSMHKIFWILIKSIDLSGFSHFSWPLIDNRLEGNRLNLSYALPCIIR